MAEHIIPEYRISVDLLRPGVFVRLEKTDWFSHPFLYSSFKITDMQQVEAIKLLGIQEVICVPEKSDVSPAEPDPAAAPQTFMDDAAAVMERMWKIKKERVERLLDKRRRIAKSEERYVACVGDLDGLTRAMASGRDDAVDEALALVRRLVSFFLGDRESTLHLMNVMTPSEQIYSHSLNVTILSLMLAKEIGLAAETMEALGMGALFHDLGKKRVEKKILKKRGELTRPEQTILESHVRSGLEMIRTRKDFPRKAMAVMAQHHERMDGTGYPEGLKDKQIDPLARITAIANDYDLLCNHPDPSKVQTPYLALSHMFTQNKTWYDAEILGIFIRCMGVYPPGTVVQLTNGSIGMVMSVNYDQQLAPSVVLYDAEIPKREALIIDLAEETDLSVEKSIRLSHLPQQILDYLSPRTKITYYVEAD